MAMHYMISTEDRHERVTRPILQHFEHLIIDGRLDFLGVFPSFRSKNTKILTIATPASLYVLPVAVKPTAKDVHGK